MNLRPPRAEDEPFLRQLRGQIDSDRLFMNYWQGEDAEEEKKKILNLQFNALGAHQNRLKQIAETKENIIEMDGAPVGRFLVAGGREELRLSEISIVPEWRGKGLGQMVIKSTMEECIRTSRVLRLCVEIQNTTALGLYRSLGFYTIEEHSLHYIMEWNPQGPTRGKLYSFARI